MQQAGQVGVSRLCHRNLKQFTKHLKLMDDELVARSLGALSQVHRLKAFRALVVAGKKGMTPGVLSEQLDISPASMSFHLKELLFSPGW